MEATNHYDGNQKAGQANDKKGSEMTEKNHLTIYEYLNRDGDPDAYVCAGHVDSVTFRDAVQQEFSVKPLVVQHRWRRSKRIVKRDVEKKKVRGYTTNVICFPEEPDSFAVTVGIC